MSSTRVRYLFSCSILLTLFAGCADSGNGGQPPTTQPATVRDRQDAALKDPFSYGGTEKGFEDAENHDVSGGDTKALDKKALKRDLDSVFNP